MNKLIAAAAVVVVLAGLTACGDDADRPAPTTAAEYASAVEGALDSSDLDWTGSVTDVDAAWPGAVGVVVEGDYGKRVAARMCGQVVDLDGYPANTRLAIEAAGGADLAVCTNEEDKLMRNTLRVVGHVAVGTYNFAGGVLDVAKGLFYGSIAVFLIVCSGWVLIKLVLSALFD